MPQNIDRRDEFTAPVTLDGGLAPLAARAAFWRSRYLKKSGFLHHLPLAFWLAEVCRPRLVVQVGMSDPQCYFAFCQAVDKLNLSGRLLGFGTWDEDGSEGPPKSVHDYNEANYPEISKIAAAAPSGVKQRLGRRRIDLLIADLAAKTADGDVLEDLCANRMSVRGCAMFYGVNAALEDAKKAALLERLRETYKTVWFDDNAGVVLVLVGDKQDARLLQLTEIDSESPSYYDIQSVFSRLGAGHYYEWLSNDRLAQLQVARKTAAQSEQQLGKLTEELAALKKSYAARDTAAEEAQITLFELNQDIEAREAKAEAAQAALSQDLEKARKELAQQKAALEEAAEESRAALDAGKTAREELQKRIDADAAALKAAEDRYLASELAVDRARKERDAAQEARQAEQDRATKAEQELINLRESQVGPLEQKLEAAQVALAQALDRQSTANAEKERLEVELETRFREIAALTREWTEQESTAQAAPAEAGATADSNQKIAELQAALSQARADVARQTDERFRETAALTRALLDTETALAAATDGAGSLTKEEGGAYRALFERYSTLLSRVQLLELEGGPTQVQDTRETWFRETALLTAEIEKLTAAQEALHRTAEDEKAALRSQMEQQKAQADQEIAKLRGDLEWRNRSAEENRKRFNLMLKLRDWQVVELQGASGRRNAQAKKERAAQVEAIESSRHFDAKWYVAKYPDVADFPGAPAEHFLRYGLFEGRNPGPEFDTLAYYTAHPEALEQRVNAVVHASGK